MPNWCGNTLNVSGAQDEVEKFKEQAWSNQETSEGYEHTDLSFENFIPYPDGEGWKYNWCVENWGTKWDACDVYLSESEGELDYTFNTAWSPPENVVEKMIELFPHLRFTLEYEEPGEGYQGVLIGSAGIIEEAYDEEYTPECIDCGFRNYSYSECTFVDDEMGYICPECKEKREPREWDEDENEPIQEPIRDICGREDEGSI